MAGETPSKKAKVEPEVPGDMRAVFIEQSAIVRQVVKDSVKETQRVLGEHLMAWASAQMAELSRDAAQFEQPGECGRGEKGGKSGS